MKERREILWTGDNWPEVLDFLQQRDFDLISYALSPDNVLNFTTSTGRFTIPMGEVVKFYPRPATRSTCTTCGGSMHDPCPYREEAEKQLRSEIGFSLYQHSQSADPGDVAWILEYVTVRVEGQEEDYTPTEKEPSNDEIGMWLVLVDDRARSLRLADEAREEKVKRAHLAVENAALRQQVQEQENKAQHWYEAWQNQDAEIVSLKQRLATRDERVKSLEEENAALQQRVASCKAFHASLCRRFGYGHDNTDWMRDFVSLEEHIASSLTRYGERTKEKAAKIDAALEGLYPWIEHTPGCDSRTEGKECSCGGNKALSNLTTAVTALQNFLSLPPLKEEGVK